MLHSTKPKASLLTPNHRTKMVLKNWKSLAILRDKYLTLDSITKEVSWTLNKHIQKSNTNSNSSWCLFSWIWEKQESGPHVWNQSTLKRKAVVKLSVKDNKISLLKKQQQSQLTKIPQTVVSYNLLRQRSSQESPMDSKSPSDALQPISSPKPLEF